MFVLLPNWVSPAVEEIGEQRVCGRWCEHARPGVNSTVFSLNAKCSSGLRSFEFYWIKKKKIRFKPVPRRPSFFLSAATSLHLFWSLEALVIK